MTKMNLKVCMCAAGLAVGLLAGTSSAQIIIMQAPNQVNGLFSDDNSPQFIADNFIIQGGGASLGVVSWYGGYFPGNNNQADSFRMRIHGDAGGVPDNAAAFLNLSGVVADTKNDTGIDLFGVDEYFYTYDLNGLNLADGTYWLEIVNAGIQENWFWETGDLDPINGVLNGAFTQDGGTTWFGTTYDQAFTIEVVPAPASLALLGLAGFCGARRRRS